MVATPFGTHLNRMHVKIINLLKKSPDYNGMQKADILNRFTPAEQMDVKYVICYVFFFFYFSFSAALDFLLDEGYAFTTVDDDHFKATAM